MVGTKHLNIHIGSNIITKMQWTTPMQVDLLYDSEQQALLIKPHPDGAFRLYYINHKNKPYDNYARVQVKSFPGMPWFDEPSSRSLRNYPWEYNVIERGIQVDLSDG